VTPQVTRTKVDVPSGVGPEDTDTIRVYFCPELDLAPMPSVSVIKALREDPDKEEGLQGWRDRFDGQSQWGRPWYKDQKIFKAYRGTLVHFSILNELGDAGGDTYFHEVGEKDWGREEYYAEYALKKWSRMAPSANTDEVPYTPRNNQYDGEHAWDKAMRGVTWAARNFYETMIAEGRLDPENVVAVEEFVYDEQYGYGGQFDLLYETPDGRVVLSDVKTSSAVRFDHKLQSAAYKRAIETRSGLPDHVDECEIVRLHPDKEVVEISRSPDWDRTLDGLGHEFLGLTDHAQNVIYSTVLDNARDELMD